jgi:hypothetical protein
MDSKADLALRLVDDFDADGAGRGDTGTLVSGVSEGELHERPTGTRCAQQRPGAVAILDVGRMCLKLDRPAVGIHQGMPLAPFDLLAGIIAPHAAAFGGSDALAIHHGGGRAGFAPNPLAVAHDQMVVDDLPAAVITQPGEPTIDRAPRRKTLRHQPPRDAAAQHIAHGVDDLPHRPCPLAATPRLGWKERLKDRPLTVGQVASIAQPVAAMLPSGGRCPHRGLVKCVCNLDESRFGPAAYPPFIQSYRWRF